MIIAVNKPSGPTSFDIVRKVKDLTGDKKVGHAGTLDPFAEGVLVIGVSRESTRQLGVISGLDKDYTATLRLGASTDTGDREGEVVETAEVPTLTNKEILAVFSQFIGWQLQIPPMYSAKKVNGIRLYKLARRKIEIAREPVEIKISSLELLALSGDDITFSVTCSKGTYIRQLGVDIAKSLGTVGHLTSLLRTRVGDFFLDDAINFKDIEQSCLFTEN
jgi:tRNA pseudouridine55 synthase